MESFDSRLTVHRASRTERLAEELIAHLHAERPANPLAPQTIVIPHIGMRRWLMQTVATSSPRAIAANFDMQLPWQWLQRTAKRVLGDDALVSGDYNADTLRWHIFNALPSLRSDIVMHYLDGADAVRRRFQLAAQLADVFSQYLVYRADMLLEWERGAEPNAWQANLWRAVRARIAAPHRAQRKNALVAALAEKGDGESLPLHVFGVSHLPPDVHECLRAVAAHRDVHIYFPDPCREHWDYIQKQRNLLATPDAESLYFEIGHPLLASLGRIGQDFSLSLASDDDHRDPLDERDVPESSANLLDAVQNGIRYLRPDLVRESLPRADASDTSLRVHAVHTRVRELEVLKDQLLGFLADDATLQPRDIVVMAPDIAAYAPYLPAVFGRAAQYSDDPAQLPWHVADVAIARTHPLFTGFSKVLDLGESRFRVSDIMDLLDVPAVGRRFGLDDEARARLQPWLRESRVAWGLDARMKAQAGAAPIDANSWSFAFDRLYSGFITGDEADASLIDGILPMRGVAGSDVDSIGKLDRLIDTLRNLRNELGTERSLAAWSVWLLDATDALFAIDHRDDGEDNAMNALRRAIAALAEQDNASGGEKLPWRVVRDVMRGALDNVADRQPFLLGGITFCGLVPQRSIPFRVVCMLGMNEGEYPRIASDGGLNRMHANPRRGDRDTRNEDRYLFLEALMAARQALHISFIGENVNDGSRRNPASPLAELLDHLDEQFDAKDDTQRPWLIRHPLQPFDRRYYTNEGDPRLFSFDRAYEIDDRARAEKHPFIAAASAEPAAPIADITLKSLQTFWRDPSKATLRDNLGIGLDALGDDALLDKEPLEVKLPPRERFELQLLDRLWKDKQRQVPPAPPEWLAHTGALPVGDLGARAYARLRKRVQPILDAMWNLLGDNATRVRRSVDLHLGDLRLLGIVDRLYECADGTLHLLHAKPQGTATFRDLLPFYIDYAALRLSGIEVTATFLEGVDTKAGVRTAPICAAIAAQSEGRLRSGLLELIRMRRDAAQTPLLFFPKTAWSWSNAGEDKRDSAARAAWEGDGFRSEGECSYEPSYAALVARDTDFLRRESAHHEKFVATNRWIAGILDPDRTTLLRAENGA